MSMLQTFFQGSDTNFGIFFPRNYLVAIFPALPEGMAAERLLRREGFLEGEVLLVPGHDVVEHAQETLKKGGLWGLLMSELSRFIGTEASYADQDYVMASDGSAFIAVHAPDEMAKGKAWALLEPLHPTVARHYSLSGIEVFRGASSDHINRDGAVSEPIATRTQEVQ